MDNILAAAELGAAAGALAGALARHNGLVSLVWQGMVHNLAPLALLKRLKRLKVEPVDPSGGGRRLLCALRAAEASRCARHCCSLPVSYV